jgi:hypothetical protein
VLALGFFVRKVVKMVLGDTNVEIRIATRHCLCFHSLYVRRPPCVMASNHFGDKQTRSRQENLRKGRPA